MSNYDGLNTDNSLIGWDSPDLKEKYIKDMGFDKAKIKISEIFASIQGEGLYAGTPSIFLRVFGCNFECRGYGMPPGLKSTEPEDILRGINNSYGFEEYKDLPLVKTGCDSYASWHKDFKQFSPFMTILDITNEIKRLLNGRIFDRNLHLVITGGEPLLGWQKNYKDLILSLYCENLVSMYDKLYITFETNGTQKLTEELCTFLSSPDYVAETTFAISSKLSSSGEPLDKRFSPEAVRSYSFVRHSNNSFFKWVISNPQDWTEAEEFLKLYSDEGIYLPVYLMPAGAQEEMYNENISWLSKLIVSDRNKLNFRLSPRLQVSLFKNQWGT
jgi:organic radical activating enzyme